MNQAPAARAHLLLAARIGFVLVTVAFAWWGFRGRWGEIGDALADTDPVRLLASLVLTIAGLVLTAVLWRALLARLGSPVPLRDAAAVFFVGQLGKYIPGSVWTFAAQAQLGRRHTIPARASVAASSIFLMLHTFTGLLLGAVLVGAGVLDPGELDFVPAWAWWLLAAGSAVALAPPLVRRIGGRIAGNGVQIAFGARELALAALLMAGVWLAYGAGIRLLFTGDTAPTLLATAGAFALSHAAGVLLIFAPAGLGAREGVLIALLGPIAGVPAAAAVALLGRVVHSVADFVVATGSWALARSTAVDTEVGADAA